MQQRYVLFIKIPSVDSIRFHSLGTWRSEKRHVAFPWGIPRSSICMTDTDVYWWPILNVMITSLDQWTQTLKGQHVAIYCCTCTQCIMHIYTFGQRSCTKAYIQLVQWHDFSLCAMLRIVRRTCTIATGRRIISLHAHTKWLVSGRAGTWLSVYFFCEFQRCENYVSSIETMSDGLGW